MTTTKTAILENEFEGEVKQSTSIPWAQFINPKNLPLNDIKKFGIPWGIFIENSQADSVKFKPDDNWKEWTVEFGAEGKEEKQTGYLATHIRFAIVQKSQAEVQKRGSNSNGWQYAGLFFDKELNWVDKFKIFTQEEKKNHRSSTRYLLVLLDEENKPLHTGVIQLRISGAAAVAFNTAQKSFYEDCEKAYFDSLNKPKQMIQVSGRSRFVLDFQLSLFRKESNSPQVYIGEANTPKMPAGQTKEIAQFERKVLYKGCSLDGILIPKSTELGAQLAQYSTDYANFAKPNKGYGEDKTVEVAPEFDDNDVVPF